MSLVCVSFGVRYNHEHDGSSDSISAKIGPADCSRGRCNRGIRLCRDHNVLELAKQASRQSSHKRRDHSARQSGPIEVIDGDTVRFRGTVYPPTLLTVAGSDRPGAASGTGHLLEI
jgi:hypothetical protein